MKNRNLLVSTILLLFAIMLAACSQKAEVVYIPEGDEYDRVKTLSDSYADHILNGIAGNDYAYFSEDFDATMLESLNETQFSSIVKTFGALGVPTSITLINIEDRDDFYGVNYKVVYPKKTLVTLIVIDKNEPNLVSGLWFK